MSPTPPLEELALGAKLLKLNRRDPVAPTQKIGTIAEEARLTFGVSVLYTYSGTR
jgi:hypothetical protein